MYLREQLIKKSDFFNCPEEIKEIILKIYDTYKIKNQNAAFKACSNLIDCYEGNMDRFNKQLEYLNKVHMRFNNGKKLI